jgi:hypothetical protein
MKVNVGLQAQNTAQFSSSFEFNLPTHNEFALLSVSGHNSGDSYAPIVKCIVSKSCMHLFSTHLSTENRRLIFINYLNLITLQLNKKDAPLMNLYVVFLEILLAHNRIFVWQIK